MKKVRIVFLLMFSVLTGAWLSAAESVVLENEQPVLTTKTVQADTIRITWEVIIDDEWKAFSFKGEEGATYGVDWGDGQTEIVTGKGAETEVECRHHYYYAKKGIYTVLLYGVSK